MNVNAHSSFPTKSSFASAGAMIRESVPDMHIVPSNFLSPPTEDPASNFSSAVDDHYWGVVGHGGQEQPSGREPASTAASPSSIRSPPDESDTHFLRRTQYETVHSKENSSSTTTRESGPAGRGGGGVSTQRLIDDLTAKFRDTQRLLESAKSQAARPPVAGGGQ